MIPWDSGMPISETNLLHQTDARAMLKTDLHHGQLTWPGGRARELTPDFGHRCSEKYDHGDTEK